MGGLQAKLDHSVCARDLPKCKEQVQVSGSKPAMLRLGMAGHHLPVYRYQVGKACRGGEVG